MARAVLVLAGLASGSSSGIARGGDLAVDVIGGVSAPLGVGGGLAFELPGRLLLAGHLGWIPSLHVDLASSAAMRLGLYDRQVGAVVEQALHHTIVVQASGGWRPFPSRGLELWVGYTQVRASGDITAGAALVGVAETDALADLELARVDALVHAVSARIGWRWLIAGHLVIRAQLGWVQTFSSHTDIRMEVRWPDRGRIDRQLADMAAHIDHDVLDKYGFTPELRLSLGFRL